MAIRFPQTTSPGIYLFPRFLVATTWAKMPFHVASKKKGLEREAHLS